MRSFGDLADSINADLGVNSAGTLGVTPGTGSAAPFTQIAFEVTVSSPYASTAFAEWVVRGPGPGGINSQNAGACVLSSIRASAVLAPAVVSEFEEPHAAAPRPGGHPATGLGLTC
jgi:hypothetical protein